MPIAFPGKNRAIKMVDFGKKVGKFFRGAVKRGEARPRPRGPRLVGERRLSGELRIAELGGGMEKEYHAEARRARRKREKLDRGWRGGARIRGGDARRARRQ
jgi:hypothetical protein